MGRPLAFQCIFFLDALTIAPVPYRSVHFREYTLRTPIRWSKRLSHSAVYGVSVWTLALCGVMGCGGPDTQDLEGHEVLRALPGHTSVQGVARSHHSVELPPSAEFDICRDGPNKPPPVSWQIFYGSSVPQAVPLSPGQIQAVGWFGSCSGVLVAPTWVLSASHCSFLWEEGEFCIDVGPTEPARCIPVAAGHDHPEADLSIVELAFDARSLLPTVQPVPFLTELLDQTWIGVTVEVAGFGEQEDGSSGVREFAAEPIVTLDDYTVTVDGEGLHGTCFGDSGGPLFVTASDGSVRVAGTLSAGEESCTGWDHFTRVDAFRAWLEAYTGPTEPVGPQPCGSVTTTGKCDLSSRHATWCGDGGVLQVDVCRDDETCSWAPQAHGWRCVVAAEDVCKGVSAQGRCDGHTLSWCGDGGLHSRDCRACGEVCVPHDSAGWICLPGDCGDITYQGECSGATVTWCNRQGEIETRDCAAEGRSCGWADDETGRWCVDDPCGEVTWEGTCEGNVATWCDPEDGVVEMDCSTDGLVCDWIDQEIGHHCRAPDGCGDIDYLGTCKDGDVLWCDSDNPAVTNCEDQGLICGWVDADVGHWCVAPEETEP